MSDTNIPFNTLVTIRLKGNNKYLKNVTLVPLSDEQAQSKNAQSKGITPDNTVRVLTGKRGRPSYLPTENIVGVRVLASANN